MKLKYVYSQYTQNYRYSELDSSGSVKKLTKRVSLKRTYGELKLHIHDKTFITDV